MVRIGTHGVLFHLTPRLHSISFDTFTAAIQNTPMTYTDRKPKWINTARTCLSVAFAAVFIAACSDGTDTLDTGGGAGDDTGTNNEAVDRINELIGFYNLPTNWAGVPESTAFFEVQPANSSGVATAFVHRMDSDQNCIETRPSSGEISLDPFTDQLFLDDLFELENSILSLTGSTLVISLPADVQDVDNDGDFDEPAVLQAPNIAVAQITDLGEFCPS